MKINKLTAALFSFVLVGCIAWTAKSKEDLSEALKKADFYRGGQVPGVSWDLTVRNIEKGELKNEISLFVEASSVEEKQFALITFLEPKKFQGQKAADTRQQHVVLKDRTAQPHSPYPAASGCRALHPTPMLPQPITSMTMALPAVKMPC